MVSNVKFSIIMCTYNSAATVVGAVNSVFGQTYENWELIVLDNGSSDDTVSILKKVEQIAVGRIKTIYLESNIGWGHGCSECMKVADGDYMMFLAADDMLSDEYVLEKVASCAIRDDSDVIFTGNYYGEFDATDGSYTIIGQTKPSISGLIDASDKLLLLFQVMKNCYYNSMFHYMKLSFLKDCGIDFYDPFYCDSESITEAIVRANKVSVIDEPLYTLTRNTSQTSTASVARIMTRQWESVKSISRVRELAAAMLNEDYKSEYIQYDKDCLSYIAGRILQNIYNQIIGICDTNRAVRNLDMNNVEISPKERLELAYAFINEKNVQEMKAIAGKVKNEAELVSKIEKLLNIVDGKDNLIHADSAADGDSIRNRIADITSFIMYKIPSCDDGLKTFEELATLVNSLVLSIAERWALYQWLERLTFVNPVYYDVDKYLRPAYRKLFYDVKTETDKCTPQVVEKYMSLLTVPENSVYILTDQFLSSGHAPTRDVLDYAYTIQKDLGYNVALVNVGLLNFENVDYIAGRTVFKFKESLNNIGAYEFKDVTFPFYQAGCVMPDVQELTNLISFISFKKPALVLSVGGPNLLCDLLRDSVKTASIPCHTYLPRSMSDNLILCKDISHVDKLQLDMLEDRQRVIQSVFNYGMPDDTAGKIYTKDELGIADNSFDIAVVGNRLTLEIDDRFLMLVDEILSMNERIKIHIIGGFEGDISGKISNTDRFIMHGKIDNAVMAIKLMKLIIQPSRTGGARAAYEALHFGIPAITTKMGDTWDVCGDDFAVNDYDEMKNVVIKYATDNEFYSIMSGMAKKRSVILEDLKGTFAQIFADMGMMG